MSASGKGNRRNRTPKKLKTTCFVDMKQHETCSTITSLIKLLHSATADRGEVDLSMLVAHTVKVDGQCFPEDHEVMFGLKTGGCYTEHRWNLFRFVKFDELIVEFDDLSPKHSEVWNTGTQIEVHTKSSSLMASHLEFPGRIRVLLPVGSLLQPPSPSDTVVMLTEASQSDGACRGRSDDVRKQEEPDRKVIVQVKVNSVLEKMFINTYNVYIL